MLKSPVDTFFDQVMVMHEDAAIRNNRLALLNGIRHLFLGAADISQVRIE
jgi:glycyl-tRNA synthetase beta chain